MLEILLSISNEDLKLTHYFEYLWPEAQLIGTPPNLLPKFGLHPTIVC